MYLLRRLPSVLCVRPLVQVKLNNSQGYVHTMEQIVRLGFVRKVAFRHKWRALVPLRCGPTGLLVQVYGILFIQVPPVSTVLLRASAPLLALYALAKRCDEGGKSADACQGLAALGNACPWQCLPRTCCPWQTFASAASYSSRELSWPRSAWLMR